MSAAITRRSAAQSEPYDWQNSVADRRYAEPINLIETYVYSIRVAAVTFGRMINANQSRDEVTINADRITLRSGEMELVVIPRRTLRTRRQLLEWIYRLTGWPGMSLRAMRVFIETVFRHHGWSLPEGESVLPQAAGRATATLAA